MPNEPGDRVHWTVEVIKRRHTRTPEGLLNVWVEENTMVLCRDDESAEVAYGAVYSQLRDSARVVPGVGAPVQTRLPQRRRRS